MNIKIDIDVTADFVADVMEEYCMNHSCTTRCPFDRIGICTEENAFNEVKDKVLEIEEKYKTNV